MILSPKFLRSLWGVQVPSKTSDLDSPSGKSQCEDDSMKFRVAKQAKNRMDV